MREKYNKGVKEIRKEMKEETEVGWLVLRLDGALQSQRLFAPVNFV